MRTLALMLVVLAPSTVLAGEAPEPAAGSYAAWQRCLRQAPPQQAHGACAAAEAAYLRALAASPLLDAHDISRSRAGLRAQAAGVYDPPTTGSISAPPRR